MTFGEEIGAKEFAEAVGWSYRTTMRRLEARQIPGARRGGRSGREWRIKRSSVEKVLRRQAKGEWDR